MQINKTKTQQAAATFISITKAAYVHTALETNKSADQLMSEDICAEF